MGRPVIIVVRPLGWHLRQTLRRRQMSQAQFAKRIGVHVGVVTNIIYRRQRISPELAKRFEAVLGISATTWLRLQEETTK